MERWSIFSRTMLNHSFSLASSKQVKNLSKWLTNHPKSFRSELHTLVVSSGNLSTTQYTVKHLEVNLTYFLEIWQQTRGNFELNIALHMFLNIQHISSISRIKTQSSFKHIHGYSYAVKSLILHVVWAELPPIDQKWTFPRHLKALYITVSSCHFQLHYCHSVLRLKALANVDMPIKRCLLFHILPLQADRNFIGVTETTSLNWVKAQQ